MQRFWARVVVVVSVLVVLVGWAGGALAVHEGTNVLVFAPVDGEAPLGAAGEGTIEFNGGSEPVSRWTVTLRFAGLAPERAYAVVLQGRTGEDGSPAASTFSGLCAFRTSATGDGGCWDYAQGMERLGVVQVRLGDERGAAVLQATRAAGGPGSIVTLPNPDSPDSVASPVGSPAGGTPPPEQGALPTTTQRGG